MKTLDRKKAEKEASLSYCEDDAVKVGQSLMGDQQYWAGSTGADAYEIRPAAPLKTSSTKSIDVFVKGPDIWTRYKGPTIIQELNKMESSIKGRLKEARNYRKLAKSKELLEVAGEERKLSAIFKGLHELDDAGFRGKFGESKTRVVDSLGKRMLKEGGIEKYASFKNGLAHPEWLAGYVPLEGVGGIDDPQFRGGKDATGGPAYYVEFLKRYVKKTERNLLRNLENAEKTREIETGKIERKMLEEARFGKMRKSPAEFAIAAGKELFGHDNLERYKESDAARATLGKNYIYKLLMKGKPRIAGTERELPEIFEGLHGLDETEFRGKFGESKEKVIDLLTKGVVENLEVVGKERKLSDIFKGIYRLDDAGFRGEFGESKNRVIDLIGRKMLDEGVAENLKADGEEKKRFEIFRSVYKLDEAGLRGKYGEGSVKHEIAGTERELPEIFEGLHGLSEAEFRGKFSETKNNVVKSIGKKFYEKDVPEIYQTYLENLKAYVGKMSDKELIDDFTEGKTYDAMLGGKTPDKLRAELKRGVDRYMKKIEKLESYFPKEDLELARKLLGEGDNRLLPQTQYQKDVLAKEKLIVGLEGIKAGRELKDPGRGDALGKYLKARKSGKQYCKES